jgi:hypothetical protein
VTASEDWARRRLHQLGDRDLPVGGQATADQVIARHRRLRRARAAWLGVAAALVLAVSIPVALAAVSSAPVNAGGAVPASGNSSADAPVPTASQSPNASADPGPIATRSGPPQAELGVAYPFDLYTHCGIRGARFAGREWTAIRPAADPQRLPDSTGITRYTGYIAGTMTLVRPDLLRFTLTDPYVSGAGQSFDFVPVVPAAGPAHVCA